MRTIAAHYLNAITRKNPTLNEAWVEAKDFVISHGVSISLGIMSIAIYILLYKFSGSLKTMALDTYSGHKAWFYVPILIMFLFSLIHGSFTSHFWDSLGIKAKKA